MTTQKKEGLILELLIAIYKTIIMYDDEKKKKTYICIVETQNININKVREKTE